MYKEPQLLVYDYAVGGAMSKDVRRQITKRFTSSSSGIAHRPEWAPWKEIDTLFGK
jgi:hypothetical protein